MMTPCFWPDARLAPSTSRICGARPGGACPGRSSIISTGAPTARSQCAGNCRVRHRNVPAALGGRDPSADLRTSVLGTPSQCRLYFAPVGSSRLFYPRGEEVAARVPGRVGTIYTLSTLSGCRLEDVAAASGGTVWYQLYCSGDAKPRWRHRARARREVLGAGRDDRHARRRPPRARRAQRRQGARVAKAVRDAAASAADSGAARLARRHARRRRPDELPQRRRPRTRADAVRESAPRSSNRP